MAPVTPNLGYENRTLTLVFTTVFVPFVLQTGARSGPFGAPGSLICYG